MATAKRKADSGLGPIDLWENGRKAVRGRSLVSRFPSAPVYSLSARQLTPIYLSLSSVPLASLAPRTV